ncbi:MAG TPA: thioesterase family protein [Anaerolineales bacterium]
MGQQAHLICRALGLAGSDELVARGRTDWVYADAVTGRPASVTPEMAAAFFPEGAPARHPEREPFPGAPPPPAGLFKTRLRVRWQDIDSAGIVNNPVYLEYVEECGFRVIAHFGWPYQRMAQAGFAVLLRKTQIRYLQPARLDDELEVATWASQVRRSTALRHYSIRRAQDGELLAQAHCLGVWVDLASGRPIRIPPEFMESFAPNLVAED